uniref:DYW domain-containing protein n=1 Tax=Arundo donax TaxID=35708 RepID=A0A0A8Z5G4_ARUDO
MCSHCHAFAKLVSEKYKRQILIKDPNCLHKFEGGKCSCEDYW